MSFRLLVREFVVTAKACRQELYLVSGAIFFTVLTAIHMIAGTTGAGVPVVAFMSGFLWGIAALQLVRR